MTRTLLWGNEDYSITPEIYQNLILNDDLRDYDFVEMVISTPTDLSNGNVWNATFDVGTLLETGKQTLYWLYAQRIIAFTTVTVNDTVYLKMTVQSSGNETAAYYLPQMFKVYGYKIGA